METSAELGARLCRARWRVRSLHRHRAASSGLPKAATFIHRASTRPHDADRPGFFLAPRFPVPANLIEPDDSDSAARLRQRASRAYPRHLLLPRPGLAGRAAIHNWEHETTAISTPVRPAQRGLPYHQPYFATRTRCRKLTGGTSGRCSPAGWGRRPLLALTPWGHGKTALAWPGSSGTLGLPLPGQPRDLPDAAACRVPDRATEESSGGAYERRPLSAFLDAALTTPAAERRPRDTSAYEKVGAGQLLRSAPAAGLTA
jgi:hypothetical protein